MDEIQTLVGGATAKKGKKPTTGSLPLYYEVSDFVCQRDFCNISSAMKTGVQHDTLKNLIQFSK